MGVSHDVLTNVDLFQLVFCSGFQVVIWRPGISIVGQLTESVESAFVIHQGDYHDSFDCP